MPLYLASVVRTNCTDADAKVLIPSVLVRASDPDQLIAILSKRLGDPLHHIIGHGQAFSGEAMVIFEEVPESFLNDSMMVMFRTHSYSQKRIFRVYRSLARA